MTTKLTGCRKKEGHAKLLGTGPSFSSASSYALRAGSAGLMCHLQACAMGHTFMRWMFQGQILYRVVTPQSSWCPVQRRVSASPHGSHDAASSWAVRSPRSFCTNTSRLQPAVSFKACLTHLSRFAVQQRHSNGVLCRCRSEHM